MNLNPLKLLNPSYLFDPRPGITFLYFWPLLVFFVLVFFASFFVKQGPIPSRLREFSVIGLLLTFFRDQNIPYLGMRFWLVLLFLAAIAYGVYLWREKKRQAALKPIVEKREDQFEKYLPKRKRH